MRVAGIACRQFAVEAKQPITDHGRGCRCGQFNRGLRNDDRLSNIMLRQSDLGEPNLIKDAAAVVTLSPALACAKGMPLGSLCIYNRLTSVIRVKGQLGIGVGSQAIDLSLINVVQPVRGHLTLGFLPDLDASLSSASGR